MQIEKNYLPAFSMRHNDREQKSTQKGHEN